MVLNNKYKPSKETRAAYNKIKNIVNKDKDVVIFKSVVKNIHKEMNSVNNTLIKIDNIADSIKNKDHSNIEHIIEAFPIETLRESCGDFSKRVKFKDISTLQKLNKNAIEALDIQIKLEKLEKIAQIELLQQKIESLIRNS